MQKIKQVALCTAILSISVLVIFLFSIPIKILSVSELKNLDENQPVFVSGVVIKESNFGSNYLLMLDNNLPLICSCFNLKGKNISGTGYLDVYSNKSYIKMLKIKIN